LVVCLSHSWGGLEKVALQDAFDLARDGVPIRFLCLRDSPVHRNLLLRAAAESSQTAGGDKEGRRSVEPVAIDYRPRNSFDWKLRAELKRQIALGINLVHTHQTSLLGSLAPWLRRERGVALVASRHILNAHDKRTAFHRWIYRRVDALVVMSEALRENVLATHPVEQRQVRVIPLGLDFNRFDPARVDPSGSRAVWGAGPDTLVIGMVGRVDPAKGQATFIQVAAGLVQNPAAGSQLKFVIVGEETRRGPASDSDGLVTGARSSSEERSYLEELRALAVELGLKDQVVFAGYQEDVPGVMRALDLFVMPSRQEAFGLVAIEAMAMEKPVILSRGGSADEIVGGGAFGVLVDPEDARRLTRELRGLIASPELRAELGRRARQHVLSRYDRRARARQTRELYVSCVASRSSEAPQKAP
jgi:glycosyltransferase involved in cell wall biosynthesis